MVMRDIQGGKMNKTNKKAICERWCKYYNSSNRKCVCELGEDIISGAQEHRCDSYYPRFDKSADTLKNLPIISIKTFNEKVAPHISSKIDTSKIETVEDIYEQKDNFLGSSKSVSDNLEMLPRLAVVTSFDCWWIVEDKNRHHCIIH